MLEITVVMLETFLCGIYDWIEDVVDGCFQVGFVLCQARTVDPVQGNVRAVGACPFSRVASCFLDAFQYFGFQVLWNLFFSNAHLDEQKTQFLWFRNLVVPPVVAFRIHVIPVLQSFDDFLIQVLVLVILVFGIGVCIHKVRQTFYMFDGCPVGHLGIVVVDVAEGTIFLE